MKKRVLITGAAGFLGSHLCDKFVKEGYNVIGMDNFITGSSDNIKHLEGNPNFKFIEHDVCNHISIDEPLTNIAVYNASFSTHLSYANERPSDFKEACQKLVEQEKVEDSL